MSGVSMTLEGAIAKALAGGQTVKQPKADELFVDIDSEEDFKVFDKQYAILHAAGYVDGFSYTYSKSGWPHSHVIVILRYPVNSELERLALQSFLGSDRKHELLSWLAYRGGNPSPTVFFE